MTSCFFAKKNIILKCMWTSLLEVYVVDCGSSLIPIEQWLAVAQLAE